MLYQKSDVFPNHVSPAFEKLSEYPNFGNMLTQADLRYFCLFMHKEKIYFQTREIAQATRNSFPSVVKKVKTLSEWMPDDIDFNKVFAKWKRPPIDCNRKNADIRAGFKLGNDFLVNGCFTFGQRTVPEGLVHVFQTLNVPMLFYLRRKDKLDRTEDAYFPCHTMCRYERRILPANTCSRIPPKTTYFVLTVQKTFFRVDVLLDAVRSFQFLDPVAKKIAKLDCLYDHPAATPFIEDLYREPEDVRCDGTLNLEDWNLFFVPTTRELPVLLENDNNVLPEQQQENDNVSPEPEQQQQQENDNVSPEQQQQENDNVSPEQQREVSLPLQILEKKVIYVENTNLLKKLEYLKREIKCPPKCKHCSGSLPEDSSSIHPEPLDLSVQKKSETLGKRKREDGEKMPPPPPPPPLENAVVETVEFGEQQTVELGEINLDEFGEQQTVELGEINLDEFGEQQTVELGEINLDELEFLFK